jgi:MscS family membrane protein
MKYLLFAIYVMTALCASAQNEEHPLLPADTTSPRATLNSFNENCTKAYEILQKVGRDVNEMQDGKEIEDALRGIERCLDLSEVADFRRENIMREAAVSLKEVLDRIELPEEKNIPDLKAMTRDDGSLIHSWTIPNTEITLHFVEEGPRQGTYQFNPYTISHAGDFYSRVKHLPYKKGATEGFADRYLTSPGNRWLEEVVDRLPDHLHDRKAGQAVWQWIGIGVVILVSAILVALLYATGRRISRKGADGHLFKYSLGLIFPVIAVFVPAKASQIIAQELVVSGATLHFIKFNLSLMTLFAAMIVVLGIGHRLGEIIAAFPHIKSNSIDAQLARLMSRLIGMIAAMVLLLQGGQHLGIPLSSLLAGAGVVGAALALSAQDVLKNIFGSVMIILDKPYAVGERIRIKGYDGVVEEIGLRSTKIRLLNGHQAVIPNEDMARSDIENIGRRPFIRRVSNIRLPVDIGAEKSEQAVKIILDLLKDHEGMNPDFPPRAWISEFADDHVELRMIYWYHPPNYWDFTAHADKLNREILDAFEKAGITIAVPAFTTKVEDHEGIAILPPDPSV